MQRLPINRRASLMLAAALALTLSASHAVAAESEPAPALEDDKYQAAFDAAIDKALAYLAGAQLSDGSFPGGMPKNNAVASLATMAFLARGYSPGLEPYGATINRSIDLVLSSQDSFGTLIGPGGGQMYAHNISTLMLSEVSGMVDPERQRKIDAVLPKAIYVILAAQQVKKGGGQQGGWRYGPNSTDSDMSHSGWAMMALRSARNNGTPVPKEAIDDAVKFILNCRYQDGGFGYQPGASSRLALSAAGLLCLELSGKHREEVTLKAGEYVFNHFQQGWNGEHFYYGIYYCAQGMYQLGEKQWEAFAPLLYEKLLRVQQPDGSWPSMPGAASEDGPGPCYRTAMATLALSVTYRQLPIYQR